jgi:hypothetical protein
MNHIISLDFNVRERGSPTVVRQPPTSKIRHSHPDSFPANKELIRIFMDQTWKRLTFWIVPRTLPKDQCVLLDTNGSEPRPHDVVVGNNIIPRRNTVQIIQKAEKNSISR